MKKRDVTILIESLIKSDNQRKVHIILNNRRFYNGVIVNYEDDDTLSFVDSKLGYINILFSQIINVEPYIEK